MKAGDKVLVLLADENYYFATLIKIDGDHCYVHMDSYVPFRVSVLCGISFTGKVMVSMDSVFPMKNKNSKDMLHRKYLNIRTCDP